jgi:hypothetical protein
MALKPVVRRISPPEGIKPRFSGRPASSVVRILIEQSRPVYSCLIYLKPQKRLEKSRIKFEIGL